MKSSFDDFIRKPFHATTIFDKLAKHLGVRYTYKEETPIAPKNTIVNFSKEEVGKILKTVSPTWTSSMKNAANRLDEEEILQLIRDIETQHPQLAEMLADFIQKLRFDEILNLFSHSEQL